MNSDNFQALVAIRLEDMANQVEWLYAQGMNEDAAVLRDEGLMLAEVYDNEATFLYINDLSEV